MKYCSPSPHLNSGETNMKVLTFCGVRTIDLAIRYLERMKKASSAGGDTTIEFKGGRPICFVLTDEFDTQDPIVQVRIDD